VSPALGLAILFILIGAQVARLVAPRRLAYAWVLLLAAIGLLAAELLATAAHFGGPSLGVLHPVADVIGIVMCEFAGALLSGRRRVP
jgi:uncharacterized membrane protein YwaF